MGKRVKKKWGRGKIIFLFDAYKWRLVKIILIYGGEVCIKNEGG